MSDSGSSGVKLPVVIGIAAASAVLGIFGSLAGFWLLSNSASQTSAPKPETESSVEIEVAESSNGSETEEEEEDGYSSIQEKMDLYVRWNVSSYVVDANRECSYGDGYLDLQVNVTNLSQASIIAGEAYVIIEDLFGNELITLDTPIDDPIGSGATGTIGSPGASCWRLLNYGGDLRLKEMADPYSSTKVMFYLESLALESGEIVKF